MKKMHMLLLAAGAYYLFSKRTAIAQATGISNPAQPNNLEECLRTQDATACARLGFQAAAGAANAIKDAITSELKGIDGCAPPTLDGHMASLGAYNGLHGSFYGGV